MKIYEKIVVIYSPYIYNRELVGNVFMTPKVPDIFF